MYFYEHAAEVGIYKIGWQWFVPADGEDAMDAFVQGTQQFPQNASCKVPYMKMVNADLLGAADGNSKLSNPFAWNTRQGFVIGCMLGPTTGKLITEGQYIHVYGQDCSAQSELPGCHLFPDTGPIGGFPHDSQFFKHGDVAEWTIEGVLRLYKEAGRVPRSQQTPQLIQ